MSYKAINSKTIERQSKFKPWDAATSILVKIDGWGHPRPLKKHRATKKSRIRDARHRANKRRKQLVKGCS